MEKKPSAEPRPFPNDPVRNFLWKAASPFFTYAPSLPEDATHRKILKAVLRNPPPARAGLAATISLALGTDLLRHLPASQPPKYSPGMVVIVHGVDGFPQGEPAFLLGGPLGWDRAANKRGAIGECLPGSTPDSAQVRLASPSETEAFLRQCPDEEAERIASLVTVGLLLAEYTPDAEFGLPDDL